MLVLYQKLHITDQPTLPPPHCPPPQTAGARTAPDWLDNVE